MSKMVSRYISENKIQGGAEIQGYMNSNGQIRYSFIRGNRNTGDCTAEISKLLNDKIWKFTCVFNEEESAKEEFELLGFLL